MQEVKQKRRIGIVRGGDVDDYERSLKDGGDIFLSIHENLGEDWKPVDILIDRNGVWHADGIPLQEKTDLVQKVDAVWNATPYFGIDSFPYAISENRNMLREHMSAISVLMPRHILIPAYQEDFDGPREKYPAKKAREIFERFGAPWIIRSVVPDPDMAIHIARTYPELVDAIFDAMNHERSIFVEEFIMGRDVSTHALSGFRGEDLYVFPHPDKRQAFASLKTEEKLKVDDLARKVFEHMGVSHYLGSDFKINSRGKIYLTDIKLIPSFDKDSDLVSLGDYVGADKHHIIGHILERILL